MSSGAVHLGDAATLRKTDAGEWQVDTAYGHTLEANQVVVVLGPWTTQLNARFGCTAPVIPERGYHMHCARLPERPLHSTIIDVENGYVIAPMKGGLRLTTGAELAHIDSPRTPTQINAAEKIAR